MSGMVDIKEFWPDWEIEKRIGTGSFGSVYRAKRTVGETAVYSAVKVISIPFTDSEVDSLTAEGLTFNDSVDYYKRLTDDLIKEVAFMESCKGHSNIVGIEDFKVVEKEAPRRDIFIRMELLTPLNTYLCDKTLSESEVIKLGIDICNALTACEKQNIIHRDIKPENIFVSVFGDFKLGDFGIARSLEGMTFGFSQKGTFNYMAPEVFNSSFYDFRADIYSLGVVLYRLLNRNRLPFLDSEKQLLSPEERRFAVERRLRGDEIPPIKGVSPELFAIIKKACSFRPEKRFGSAEEMKEALEKVTKDQKAVPVTEEFKTPSTEEKSVRNTWVKVLATVCILFLLADIVLGVLIVRNKIHKGTILPSAEQTNTEEVKTVISKEPYSPSVASKEMTDLLDRIRELVLGGQYDEAGVLLSGIIKENRLNETGCDEYLVTDGYFSIDDKDYSIARQYWKDGGALISLYYTDVEGNPERFHYRIEDGSMVSFIHYDMDGNYLSKSVFN